MIKFPKWFTKTSDQEPEQENLDDFLAMMPDWYKNSRYFEGTDEQAITVERQCTSNRAIELMAKQPVSMTIYAIPQLRIPEKVKIEQGVAIAARLRKYFPTEMTVSDAMTFGYSFGSLNQRAEGVYSNALQEVQTRKSCYGFGMEYDEKIEPGNHQFMWVVPNGNAFLSGHLEDLIQFGFPACYIKNILEYCGAGCNIAEGAFDDWNWECMNLAKKAGYNIILNEEA